jgi:hypothetical protein
MVLRLAWSLRNSRPTYVACLRSITMPGFDRKGQTRREAGAQSLRTSEGGGWVAESPRAGPKVGPARAGAQRGLHECPQGVSQLPGTDRNRDLARLKPHLEEALGTLERLEQKRGLSDREKMRGGTLKMLLASIEEVK